jgi:hypothetical protein
MLNNHLQHRILIININIMKQVNSVGYIKWLAGILLLLLLFPNSLYAQSAEQP